MFSLPPADLGFIEESLYNLKRSILEAFEDGIKSTPINLTTPDVLIESLERLLPTLAHCEMYATSAAINEYVEFVEERDINTLANYGLQLIADLIYWSRLLELSSVHDELRRIGLALALWIAQHGAEINLLEHVVDNLEFVIGDLNKRTDLEQAYRAASQIMDAVNLTSIVQVRTKSNIAWRKLLLQRATIALRTQSPLLMSYAFDCLIEFIPNDAVDFLRYKMVQLNDMPVPNATREFVEEYFKKFCVVKSLH